MTYKYDEHLDRVLDMVSELMKLADEGDDTRCDVGCGVLYGTVRDCAYKIKALAEAEKKVHQQAEIGG